MADILWSVDVRGISAADISALDSVPCAALREDVAVEGGDARVAAMAAERGSYGYFKALKVVDA
jgi:Asp-tRNA(Asn)/Glu-tRNA(Gln) amidotransferase C subunit